MMIIRTPYIRRSFSFWPLIFIVKSTPEREATHIIHERVHYDRQRWITPCWVLRYIFFKSFRWAEEKLAYRVEILHKREQGIYFSTVWYASVLSSRQYCRMCSLDEATEFISSIITERT